MAIAHVQSTKLFGSGTTSIAKAYASNVTAGNLLVASAYSSKQVSPTFGTPTDSQSNTWGIVVTATGSSGYTRTHAAYAYAGSTGACTVTQTFDASCNAVLMISEYSGIASSSPVDQYAGKGSTSGSGTTIETDAVTTTQNDELLYAAGAVNDGYYVTAHMGAGFTIRTSHAGDFDAVAGDYIVSSTGSYTGYVEGHSNGARSVVLVTFKMAVAAASGKPWYAYAQQ